MSLPVLNQSHAKKSESSGLSMDLPNSSSSRSSSRSPWMRSCFHLAMMGTLACTALGGLSGCQAIKNFTDNKDPIAAKAGNSEEGYYQEAMLRIDKGHYNQATEELNNLRTFYPTGRYAEQALLDLIYVQYQAGEYETAVKTAEQFMRLYPNNPQISYAYYVRGVANMQGPSGGMNLIRLNQAQRDMTYFKVAFANFQELLNKYPNSVYAPDAAQRMLFIYNQLAEHELVAARWYMERKAYVAAVNRAKWVFQYFPQSEAIPESLVILAEGYDKLGQGDLANNYKTLLQINYPNYTKSGRTKKTASWLNKLTLGVLGRSGTNAVFNVTADPSTYQGQTKTQIIGRANQLNLPKEMPSDLPSMPSTKRQINVGLDLPEDENDLNPQVDQNDHLYTLGQNQHAKQAESDFIEESKSTTEMGE